MPLPSWPIDLGLVAEIPVLNYTLPHHTPQTHGSEESHQLYALWSLHLSLFWSPQHWQQFEPQLTLWDVFGARSKEVDVLLEQGLLQLDHRCVGVWGLVRSLREP